MRYLFFLQSIKGELYRYIKTPHKVGSEFEQHLLRWLMGTSFCKRFFFQILTPTIYYLFFSIRKKIVIGCILLMFGNNLSNYLEQTKSNGLCFANKMQQYI